MAITTLLTFSGVCMLFAAFPLDIQANLNDLNNDVINVHHKFTPENRTEFYKWLSEIAEIHKTAQQLSWSNPKKKNLLPFFFCKKFF